MRDAGRKLIQVGAAILLASVICAILLGLWLGLLYLAVRFNAADILLCGMIAVPWFGALLAATGWLLLVLGKEDDDDAVRESQVRAEIRRRRSGACPPP